MRIVVVFFYSSYIRVFGPFQTEADAKHGCDALLCYPSSSLCVSSTHRVRHMKHIARFVRKKIDNSRAPVDRSVDAIARESGRRGQSTPPKSALCHRVSSAR